MTFSDKVKLEITLNAEELDRASLIAGFIRGNVWLTLENKKFGCVLSTDLAEVAAFAFKLLASEGAELDTEQKRGLNPCKIYNLKIRGERAQNLLTKTGIAIFNELGLADVSDKVPDFVKADEEKLRAYVTGIFLSAGAVFIPENVGEESRGAYQLEFLFISEGFAADFADTLARVGFVGKLTERKETAVLYFKESETISDLLAYVYAPEAVMDIQNVKVLRSVRNKENRISNCVVANIGKAVDAAIRQISAIETLKESGKLARLPDKLKETAELRLSRPEDKLETLAEELNITKSCINHRLRKLESLARGEE